ncbi:hypothetical protein RFI_28995 [Reticulomyxa filosa]|uniref:Uncharacterized protein n=1 Tax=Reticulomyxa filosa TaxID=46433 RepID=X6M4L7_RETFI|nr:hypothetical protein RFI_28995 [Reticulomyxa filosa]|eukprot:ETO08392.1 hypothetical protein RFI_28995 [Reticulomyxa filosa]
MASTDPSTIAAAVRALETTYMSHGIAINSSKCEWIAHQSSLPPSDFRSSPHNKSFNTTLVSIPLGNEEYRDNVMFQSVTKCDEQFDKETLESILAHPITDSQWLHSQLPINKGGLGIRKAEPFKGDAYIVSAIYANRKLLLIHKDITNILWIPLLEFDKAVAHYNSNSYSASNNVNIIDIHTTLSQAKKPDKKAIGSNGVKTCIGYLKALTNIFTKSHFGNNKFRSLLQYCIGQDETTYSKCQGGNACQDAMDQPGDIALKWFNSKYEKTFFDIGITHKNMLSERETCNASIESYYQYKIHKYGELCKSKNISYITLIAESTGQWRSEAVKVFNIIADILADKENREIY